MSSGFNTNVRVGERTFHVQTEDRGPHHPQIDTIVYFDGRVLHRRSSSYQELTEAGQATEEVLRRRVEEHHREVIEALRAGSLGIDSTGLETQRAVKTPAHGIDIRLSKFLPVAMAGSATMEIEVSDRLDRQAIAGASIEVTLEGAKEPFRLRGTTDAQGRSQWHFAMPAVGAEGGAFVIKAIVGHADQTIRYSLRPRSKSSASPKTGQK